MKILVAAKQIDVDKTSAGIGTCKLVAALGNLGHQVKCLTSAATPFHGNAAGSVPWLPGVKVCGLDGGAGPWTKVHGLLERLTGVGNTGDFLADRMNLALAIGTGYQAGFWCEVERWSAALRRSTALERPDVVFVRSAGVEFHAHLAMLQQPAELPWVANYHDPYPYSLYPEPYRIRTPIVSWRQEAVHRRILRRAWALTFPSRRLLEWVLSSDLEPHRRKAFVVPHIAMPLSSSGNGSAAATPPFLDTSLFNIVHTGTLLGQREPHALLEGFLRFTGQDEEKRAKARLVFVGRVDRRHVADATWQYALQQPNIVCIGQRISYDEALGTARGSVAAVVIEADCPVSPFFPAKLADYIWLQKPVLALTPRESAVTDLLGPDYPLLAAPNDPDAVTRALALLWDGWKRQSLEKLIPSRQILESISERSAGASLQSVFEAVAFGEIPAPRRV